jgi:hypothetical protein
MITATDEDSRTQLLAKCKMKQMTYGKLLTTLGLVTLSFVGLAPLRSEPMVMSTQMPIVVAHDVRATRTRLESNVLEVENALKEVGSPIAPEAVKSLDAVSVMTDYDAVGSIQTVLDKYALLSVRLNDEAWFQVVPASPSPQDRILTKGRWQTFLVKVDNASRVTSPLEVRSGQAIETLSEENRTSGEFCVQQPHDWSRWFLMRKLGPPLMSGLMSGKEVEYFVIQLCSLDAGDRAAELTFFLGGGQVSQGHYGSTMMVFKAVDTAASR